MHDHSSRDSFWMPFTPNRTFKAAPKLLVSAKGMHYQTDDGRAILDATSGLWCVNAGHGREEITKAIQDQAQDLDYAPNFNMAHPKAFEFTSKLATILPDGINRIFLTNSGSEAADTALKIALAYQRIRGQSSKNATDWPRTRLSWHGFCVGSASARIVKKPHVFWGLDRRGSIICRTRMA